MMNTVGHHLYFMMLCVGMADGHTSDEESKKLQTRASEQVARLCQRDGWDKYDILEKKEQDILKEAAAHLLFSIKTHSLWENFTESVRAMPSSSNQNELNDLYDALKSVAEADGIINTEARVNARPGNATPSISEYSVLEFVSAEWGLVGSKAELDTYFANNCVCGTVSKINGNTLQSYIDDYMMYECDGCGRDINPSFGWYPISFDEYLED